MEIENAQSRETAAKLNYRQLSQEEIALVERSRSAGKLLRDLLADAMIADADPRWIAIAQTDFQRGLMSLVRAISKPEFF